MAHFTPLLCVKYLRSSRALSGSYSTPPSVETQGFLVYWRTSRRVLAGDLPIRCPNAKVRKKNFHLLLKKFGFINVDAIFKKALKNPLEMSQMLGFGERCHQNVIHIDETEVQASRTEHRPKVICINSKSPKKGIRRVALANFEIEKTLQFAK